MQTLEMFKRHQEDVRIENLLLQKEVNDLLLTHSNSSSDMLDFEGIQTQMFYTSNEDVSLSSSSLLEQIVYSVVSKNQPENVFGQIYSHMMYLFKVFMSISLFFLTLSVALLYLSKRKSSKSDSAS